MHSRLEKSGFHPGEYVGYCDGPWKIKKIANPDSRRALLWEATKADGTDYFRGRTLDSIGKGLDERANVATGRILFRGN